MTYDPANRRLWLERVRMHLAADDEYLEMDLHTLASAPRARSCGPTVGIASGSHETAAMGAGVLLAQGESRAIYVCDCAAICRSRALR